MVPGKFVRSWNTFPSSAMTSDFVVVVIVFYRPYNINSATMFECAIYHEDDLRMELFCCSAFSFQRRLADVIILLAESPVFKLEKDSMPSDVVSVSPLNIFTQRRPRLLLTNNRVRMPSSSPGTSSTTVSLIVAHQVVDLHATQSFFITVPADQNLHVPPSFCRLGRCFGCT